MKRLIITICVLFGTMPMLAQDYPILNEKDRPQYNIFNHLDAAVTLGTTGIGVEVASPVTNWAQLRLGYAFMPRFHYHMNFDVQVGEVKESKYDANGNRVETKFDKMAALLEDLSGYKVNDEVEMIGRPTYHNLIRGENYVFFCEKRRPREFLALFGSLFPAILSISRLDISHSLESRFLAVVMMTKSLGDSFLS